MTPEIERDREVQRLAKKVKLPPYMWDTLEGMAALYRFMEAARTSTEEKGLTEFYAVGWWDGEKALFEPNQIPVRGALLFRPLPSAPSQQREHVDTDRCGFDRNSSLSEDRYVCDCGWRGEK